MVTSNRLYGIIAGLTRVIYLLNCGLFSAQGENTLIERVVMMDGPLGHEMAAESDGDDDGVGVGYGKAAFGSALPRTTKQNKNLC